MEEFPISVRNVYKVFGRRPADAVKQLESGTARADLDRGTTAAVIDATFDVKPGEIFVVMGLSGSGKSTLIRTLNGLHDVSAGSILVHGVDLAKASPAEIRAVRQDHVSMVFQHFALFPHRTVLENVAFGLEVKGVAREARLEKARGVLDRVGLGEWADRLPSALSGGMQQRVGIARALAADTDIMLMDEAFSALDPLIRREMQQELVDLQADLGKTIVFITHDLNEAMFLGDRIAVMRDGRIVQIGTPEDILTDPANDYVAQFVQDVDRARVLTAESVMEQPRAVVPLTAGPRAALRVMRDTQAGGVYVTDRGRLLAGAVTDRRVMRDVKAGSTDLRDSLITDIATVAPDAPIADLIELAVDSPLPIAVVDEGRRLVGVVPRVTLLAALANVPNTTGLITLPERITDITPEEVAETLGDEPPVDPLGDGLPAGTRAGDPLVVTEPTTPETEGTDRA